MNHKLTHRVLLAFIAATAVRVILAPFTGHPYDLTVWMAVGKNVASFLSPYEVHPHLGYPPLWGFWCGVSYALSQSIMPFSSFPYIFLIKLPIIVGDICIAWLLVFSRALSSSPSSFGNQKDYRSLPSSAHAELFLFNPYVVIAGVVWGMMDNIVALLVVLMVIALSDRKYALAGVLLGLSISLKLYPILFLPVCLLYIWKNDRRIERVLLFLVAINATALVSTTLPFLIFHWNTGGFLGVAGAQSARSPGGIAPIGILAYLPAAGVNSIGPFSVIGLYENTWLRFLWVPAIAIALMFVYRRKLSSLGDAFGSLLLTYAIYVALAPWVSEPNVEMLFVLMIFSGVSKCVKLSQYFQYFLGSTIVFIFIVLHAPITSFLFPVLTIDATPLQNFSAPLLPWVVIAFAAYSAIVVRSIIRQPKPAQTPKVL